MFNPFDLDKIAKDFKKASESLDGEQLRTEIFNAFFQGFQGKEMPEFPRGKDLYYNLSLCFNDAMLGSKQEIRIRRLEATTNGELNRVTRILKFTIPKDQGHESTLKLKEQGDASDRGGKPGDLFIVLVIPEDDKERKYNDLNNDIFINIKVASDNFNRDLSKMLLLNTDIQEVEQGDTFGEDLRLDLTIGFNDAIRGCDREIKISRLGRTDKGKLEQVVKSLKVNIPAGTTHGNKLRLKGQGDACKHGGKTGDLYLSLLITSQDKEHDRNDVNVESEVKTPKSHSRGEDLHVDLAIGFNDALLGCVRDAEIFRLEMNARGELKRVASSLKFTIPAGTNNGDRLRLKGQGDACKHGGETGDLYLCLIVRSPEKARSSDKES